MQQKLKKQPRWQRDWNSLHYLGVGCDRHAAGQNVVVHFHTAHVQGLFWRLSIHVGRLP